MPETREEILLKQHEKLAGQYAGWKDYWEDIANFCLPRKGWQTTIRNVNDRLKLNSLFDSTAVRALQMMAAGFHSNLTNPSSLWFSVELRDKDLMQAKQVQFWFKEVNDKMFAALSNSNFDTTIDELYTDSGAFGTGIIMVMEDFVDKVRYTSIPPSEVVIEEDDNGRVNRIYRLYEMTVRQAYGKWGVRAGSAVLEKLADKPQDKVCILHYVGPRDRRDDSKADNLNMPYESLWIEKSKKELLQESGFHEFPFAVGRFYKDSNDVFGFSPAMHTLADIKLVNAMQRTMLRASMKVADPPLVLPRKGYVMPLNANPAALNYRDAKTTTHDDLQQLPTSGGIPITRDIIMDIQLAIEKGFFLPLFKAISDITKQMTVPEVQRRIAENMVLLGPVIGRFTDEVLDPLLVRTFSILFRNGEFSQPPQVIMDQELDIVYTSPLAKVQRESEVFSIESFLADVGGVAQAIPSVLDKINGDAVVDVIAKIKAIDPRLVRDNNEVAQIRQQRAEQQALAQRLEVAERGAGAVKTAEEAAAVGREAQP